MKKMLDGLRWRPRWVSHLGCLKGCLDYLGVDISWEWLYGGTGHAFIINVHDVICPSGPTAWDTEMLIKLGGNLGHRSQVVFSMKRDPDFADKQREAWALVRGHLDADLPCYGWELQIPEFYAIHGYDDVGYYYSGAGCDDGAGPKPWRSVGDSGIGVLEMYSVEPCPAADDCVTVRDALRFALEHAQGPSKWVFPAYHSGPEAFDVWASALENGKANRFGQGYNGAVWAECREMAAGFLREAKERLPGKADDLFDEAIGHYAIVASRLKALSELLPFEHGHEDEDVTSSEGAALVRGAASAEREGLVALQRLVDEI